jgi:hypothetical protein
MLNLLDSWCDGRRGYSPPANLKSSLRIYVGRIRKHLCYSSDAREMKCMHTSSRNASLCFDACTGGCVVRCVCLRCPRTVVHMYTYTYTHRYQLKNALLRVNRGASSVGHCICLPFPCSSIRRCARSPTCVYRSPHLSSCPCSSTPQSITYVRARKHMLCMYV